MSTGPVVTYRSCIVGAEWSRFTSPLVSPRRPRPTWIPRNEGSGRSCMGQHAMAISECLTGSTARCRA